MARIGHDAWAIAHGKSSVWVKKLKMPKRCEKRLFDLIKDVVCEKTDPKNTSYSKNENSFKMAKIGHDAWAIAHVKCSVVVKN